MTDPIIYLASPYTDEDPNVMEWRYRSACYAAFLFMAKDKIVYSAIGHSHPIAKIGELPRNWEYWKKADTAFLERCSEMIVLQLPGWRESKGIAEEIEIAKRLGIPVSYTTIQELEQ